MLAESTTVKIEVEPPHLLVVFDRKCDHFAAAWQNWYDLLAALELAITDVTDESPPDSVQLNREANQVRINAVTMGSCKGFVVLVFDWTDRLRLTWRSASLLRDALRIKTQDAMLACRGVHFKYNSQGLISELHNVRAGTVQIIPGR